MWCHAYDRDLNGSAHSFPTRRSSDLLLVHVIDLSNPCYRDQMKVVDDLLRELGLGQIPCLKVFNKADRVGGDGVLLGDVQREGVVVSALQRETLGPLLVEAQKMMGKILGK